MRADAGCPIRIDIASHSFCLALGDGVVRGSQAQFIEISKSLKDRAHGAACLLGYLIGLGHRRVAAKQPHEGLDECLPSAFAVQAAAIKPWEQWNLSQVQELA